MAAEIGEQTSNTSEISTSREFSVEVAPGGQNTLATFGKDIKDIYESVFSNIYSSAPGMGIYQANSQLESDLEVLQKDLENEATIVVVLRNKEQKIVGFSYAQPADHTQQKLGDESKTATIHTTAILNNYRQHGGWRHMMTALYGQLQHSGFEYIERDIRTADGYDKGVEAFPGGEIVEKTTTQRKYLGSFKHYRIKMHPPA